VGKENGRRSAPLLTLALLLAAIASVFRLISQRPLPGMLFNGCAVVDLYSVTLMGICLVSGLLCCLYSVSYLERERAVTGEYYALLLLAVSGMLVLVVSADFLTLFVGLELMSISSYALAGYFRNRPRPVEAALKYFLSGVFASGFLLYGIALFYGASSSLRFVDLRHALEMGQSPLLIALGSAMLLVGFGFKIAAVPFHAWAPDVYDGAPAPVSALLSTGVKTAAVGILARVLVEGIGLQGPWTFFLGVLAVLTMTVGNLGALHQTNLKRLLGFSSVAHAGYLLVGLSVAASAPSDQVERAVAFYLLAYTLMTSGAFGFISWAALPGRASAGGERVEIRDYRGLGLSHPWLGVALALFLFSLAGMTPTAGFFGKYFLFKLAVDQGQVGLVVVAVLNSFLSAFYYLRAAAALYQKPEGREEAIPLSPGVAAAVLICSLGTLALGFLKFSF
jgi:NADH-quinone oxidoreductase subunit N